MSFASGSCAVNHVLNGHAEFVEAEFLLQAPDSVISAFHLQFAERFLHGIDEVFSRGIVGLIDAEGFAGAVDQIHFQLVDADMVHAEEGF
ncbi:MAG: hypothetical protein ABS40_04520 [Agrobacterium sp. SCN 61-19]|nr:MAG: hypothetical protein ABS40_04520 [Agrobacterium sp. SCN 61-19]